MHKNWSSFYLNNFSGDKFCSVINSLSIAYNEYSKLSRKELFEYGKLYKKQWNKCINLIRYFLHNNLIFAEDETDCIKYIMYTGIFDFGEQLYAIHRKMINLDKNNNILPMKYFAEEYLDIFYQIKNFFEQRLKEEIQNEMVS